MPSKSIDKKRSLSQTLYLANCELSCPSAALNAAARSAVIGLRKFGKDKLERARREREENKEKKSVFAFVFRFFHFVLCSLSSSSFFFLLFLQAALSTARATSTSLSSTKGASSQNSA